MREAMTARVPVVGAALARLAVCYRGCWSVRPSVRC